MEFYFKKFLCCRRKPRAVQVSWRRHRASGLWSDSEGFITCSFRHWNPSRQSEWWKTRTLSYLAWTCSFANWLRSGSSLEDDWTTNLGEWFTKKKKNSEDRLLLGPSSSFAMVPFVFEGTLSWRRIRPIHYGSRLEKTLGYTDRSCERNLPHQRSRLRQHCHGIRKEIWRLLEIGDWVLSD